MKLLIAEDDISVCEMLRLFFQKEQFDATFVHDGLNAQARLEAEPWDFVILDWMLPGKDGITLCQQIRANADTPVILLTARDEEQDRIRGLEQGADDYVTKPFSPMELIARMKAVLRRYKSSSGGEAGDSEAGAGSSDSDILSYKNIAVNLSTRIVTVGDRTVSNLTPKEFDLFVLFLRYPKRVFTREQLLENIWGYDYIGEERTIDVHIRRLRNKVSSPEYPLIVTVWGVGYKLED
ncbi:response regulator transcription factor [Paenibacillus ginsengihumi]|uniref:response regulator transcription factor n=1 Tax=Paenibacillus ginsengihumi TaxID=431596 RepID=UPI00037E5D09|nr:response regulator transcription factor [Paenibacillus ginsengihumi]